MSLALYLQMVGRGLRPKDDTCLILDSAANSVTHGLPEDFREWSLEPRAEDSPGEAPVVWCPECETVSHAASHCCANCGYPFGKDCGRCGKWRAWKRWRFEKHCGNAHALVCDLCHIDAHIQSHLPVTERLVEMIGPDDTEDGPMNPPDDDLAIRLAALLKELLETERASVTGTNEDRRLELFETIERREAELTDDYELDALFGTYIADLRETKRPKSQVQERRIFNRWEESRKSELADWKNKFTNLESQQIDKRAIFDSARNIAMHLLKREAQAAGLLLEGDSSSAKTSDTPQPPKGPTGQKRNEAVKDYLIPVIRLMRDGNPLRKGLQVSSYKSEGRPEHRSRPHNTGFGNECSENQCPKV